MGLSPARVPGGCRLPANGTRWQYDFVVKILFIQSRIIVKNIISFDA